LRTASGAGQNPADRTIRSALRDSGETRGRLSCDNGLRSIPVQAGWAKLRRFLAARFPCLDSARFGTAPPCTASLSPVAAPA